MKLTSYQRKAMRMALGLDESKTTWRNFYGLGPAKSRDQWLSLVKAGLAVEPSRDMFRVTRDGLAAVILPDETEGAGTFIGMGEVTR